nr:unnamed protein product [Callosobruchus analis]
MGCNSTKNLTVEPFNGHVSENHAQARRPSTGKHIQHSTVGSGRPTRRAFIKC